ncbi:GNAT family N-acetyltransferase [Enterobacteriaceae bacterium H16N7]|nr:GNAT family N-acetyltransferase [Dryocola clanedunensis]
MKNDKAMLKHMINSFSDLPVPARTLMAGLECYLHENLSYCSDPAFSHRFPSAETGLEESFFLQRIVHSDGAEYLTGPRYLSGDLNTPFIELLANSAPLSAQAADDIFKSWRALDANVIRVLRKPCQTERGEPDQLIYASSCTFCGLKDDSVVLSKATESCMEWCLEAIAYSYEATYLMNAELKSILQPTDVEELADAIACREVFIIFSHGQKVGVIICRLTQRAFLHGYWITEEVILPEFRGRSLATKAQRQLQQMIAEQGDNQTLLGVIASVNTPSIVSAIRTGRTCILEYAFMSRGDFNV